MTTYCTARMNFENDSVTPTTPSPSSDNSAVGKKLLLSSIPFDYSSPEVSRPAVNYYQKSVVGSGGGGGGGGSSCSSNRTPLSSLTSLELSPHVKVKEDVIFMDGVMVISNSGSKCGSGGAGGGEGCGAGIYGSVYKTVLCKSWEESGGYCRYGHKCQFAHGQEELRASPNRLRNLTRFETQMSQFNISPKSSHYSTCSASSLYNVETTPPVTSKSTSKLTKPSPPLSKTTSATVPQTTTYPDWSPLDDGITATLPDSTAEPPTTSSVDESIFNVLYGRTRRRRLPVFVDICPE